MAIETEIKLLISDLDLFRADLGRLKPVRISERHFEDNYVLDFPDAQMRSRGRLLRIRITSGASFLTLKEAALPESAFKIREELETTVPDGPAVLAPGLDAERPRRFLHDAGRRRGDFRILNAIL